VGWGGGVGTTRTPWPPRRRQGPFLLAGLPAARTGFFLPLPAKGDTEPWLKFGLRNPSDSMPKQVGGSSLRDSKRYACNRGEPIGPPSGVSEFERDAFQPAMVKKTGG